MKNENILYRNKTRRKFEIIKSMDDNLDYSVTLDKLKTEALLYGDYVTAAEIRKWQIKEKNKKE